MEEYQELIHFPSAVAVSTSNCDMLILVDVNTVWNGNIRSLLEEDKSDKNIILQNLSMYKFYCCLNFLKI